MFKRLKKRESHNSHVLTAVAQNASAFTKGFDPAKDERERAEEFYQSHPLCRPLDLFEPYISPDIDPLSLTEDEVNWTKDLRGQTILDEATDEYVSSWNYFNWDDLTTTFAITESYPKLHIDA